MASFRYCKLRVRKRKGCLKSCINVILIVLGISLFVLWATNFQVQEKKEEPRPFTIWSILRESLKKNLINLPDKSQTAWLEALHTKNSLTSWIHLNVDIILFGTDDACKFVQEFLPEDRYTCLPIPCIHPEYNVPTYDCLFSKAANLSRSDILIYANSDMMLFDDLLDAATTVSEKFPDFLMIGQRTDLLYPRLVDFSNPSWKEDFIDNAQRLGKLHGEYGVDYFAYKRMYARKLPPFLVGRVRWDNWLLAQYIGSETSVAIDSTQVVFAVHLNHMSIGDSGKRTGTDYNKGLTAGDVVDVKKIGDIFSTDYYIVPHDNDEKQGACPSCRFIKRDVRLDVLLYKHSKNGTIIMPTVNEGYVDFAVNWACSLAKVGLTNFMFHASDPEAKAKLQALGYPAYYYESDDDRAYSQNNTVQNEGVNGVPYGSVAYQGLMNTRTEFIYKVLQKGYNILLCDVDIVFLRNPLLTFDQTLDIQGGAHKDVKITGGFIYLRSTPKTMNIWMKVLTQHRELFRKIQAGEPFNPHTETEQELLNNILLATTEDQVKWGRVPQTVLADGKNFFIDKESQSKGIWPYAIHNNYIIGKTNKYERFVNTSLWNVEKDLSCKPFPSYLPPLPAPPKPKEPILTIKVITFDRPKSLKRLFKSLFKANYHGDRVDLGVYIDYPETFEHEVMKNRDEVIQISKSFKWKYGEKEVIVRDKHYGLAGQWLNVWFPTTSTTACLILEDDNVVSPIFYTWTKNMLERFYFDPKNYDPRVYGISMQNQHMIAGNYPNKPASILKPDQLYYRYQQLSTWGPIFFPNHWSEFLTWQSEKSKNPDFRPLFSNMITNTWFIKRGGGTHVWSAWFMRFAAEKGWYTIYTNFPDGAALVVNWRDKGVNYGEDQGPNSKMFEDENELTYPESMGEIKIYDYHFNEITELPSILEDRAIYSDTFNIETH